MTKEELINAIESDRNILGDILADDVIEAIRDGGRGRRHSEAIDALSYDARLSIEAVKIWNDGCPVVTGH